MNRAFIAGSNGPRSWDPLSYARKDAGDLAECLSSSRCGFQVEMPGADADALAVRDRLYAAADSCTEQDTFLCYFGGHGILEHGSLFLLWDGTDLASLLRTGLPATAFTEAMRFSRAGNKLLILDCCHAGAAIGQGFRDISNVEAQAVVTADNHLVLMASDRLQRARELDALGGGFLTQQLCLALSGRFAEVAGPDRRVSIGDVKKWLEAEAVRHNESDPDHAVPIPYLFGQQRGGEFFFTSRAEWRPASFHVAGSEFVLLPFQWTSPGSQPWVLLVGKHPVLNKDYHRYVSAAGAPEPSGSFFVGEDWVPGFEPWGDDSFNDPLQPAVCLSLDDAWAYSEWVAYSSRHLRDPGLPIDLGKLRVPSVTDWDMAAFGVEYPSRNPASWLTSAEQIHHRAAAPAPVDTTGARDNRFGVSDMIGNVWEWCGGDSDSSAHLEPAVAAGPSVSFRLGGSVVLQPGHESTTAAVRGGGYLDDLARTEPFVNEWELRERRETRHSDLGVRLALRLFLANLPAPDRERVEACDLHTSVPAPMSMPSPA